MPPPASQDVNATGCDRGPSALAARHAAELGRPDDDRIVEQPRGLQILEQGGGRAVHAACPSAVVAGEVLVRVPVAARKAVVGAAPDLHEAHAAFEQSAGDQAIAAEVFGHRLVEAVERSRRRGLAREVEDLGALNCSRAASS